METNYQDRIDLYLNGKMPFVDRLNFESELESNAELQEQYRFTLSLQDELVDRQRKMDLIDSWKDDPEELLSEEASSSMDDEVEFTPIDSSRKRKIYRRIGWAAAAILLLLFVIALPDSQNQKYEIAKSEKSEEQTAHTVQLDRSHMDEVSFQEDVSTPVEKLTLTQQKKYWQRAQYYQKHGQREECMKCLQVLLQQDGIYRDKADSLLHVIYQTQK